MLVKSKTAIGVENDDKGATKRMKNAALDLDKVQI